jgi:hypothetical protein
MRRNGVIKNMPSRAVRIALAAFGSFLCLAAAFAAGTPDAVTPDGGRYYGRSRRQAARPRPHRVGNGAVYEGELANGLVSGKGRMRFGNGNTYEGEFRDGLMSGRGRFQDQNGDLYEGEFKQDYYWGEGEFRAHDGRVYRGGFMRGDSTARAAARA